MDDDRLKIFLSNLAGRIKTADLHEFFKSFGSIDRIESLTQKSAIVNFSHFDSVNRVLSKHRTCVINKQEIYIRRIRYGYIERAYMDSTVMFIKPVIHCSSMEWNESSIRHCFHPFEKQIKRIRILSKYSHAFVYFDDYDLVDRLLLEREKFHINGIDIEMKRDKCDAEDFFVKNLLEKNRVLQKEIERKGISLNLISRSFLFLFLGQKMEFQEELKYLRSRIKRLKREIDH